MTPYLPSGRDRSTLAPQLELLQDVVDAVGVLAQQRLAQRELLLAKADGVDAVDGAGAVLLACLDQQDCENRP